jgi:hypothetical protein
MFFKQYNLFMSMIAVIVVYGWRSLFVISQSAYLNDFKAHECGQLVFTTSQREITTFPLGYEHSIWLAFHAWMLEWNSCNL